MNLFKQYEETPEFHIHINKNLSARVFNDALFVQWRRIKGNLQKCFPDKTDDEIVAMMRYGEEI